MIKSQISPFIITQRSKLGPIIFLLFINDLPLTTLQWKHWLFEADNVRHLSSGRDASIFVKKILDEIVDRRSENGEAFNNGKTRVLQYKKTQLFTLSKSKIERNHSTYSI